MNRRIAVSVAVLIVVVLAWTATACGNSDPFSGTWSTPDNGGTFVIAKARDGWWSIDFGPGVNKLYGADINGELQTPNGDSGFKPDGDALLFRDPTGSEPIKLTRQ